MKNTILWTLVLFTPLLWTTSVHAIFGIPDVAALAQRVTIIANQGIQIAHSVTQISRITEQMTEIKNQYEHLKDEALGHVGALTSPLTDLAALPGTFVSDGLAWRSDYAGTDTAGLIDALDLFSASGTTMTDYWRGRLDAAPVVTEADVIADYSTLPVSLADRAAANYRRLRDEGDQRDGAQSHRQHGRVIRHHDRASRARVVRRAARANEHIRHRARASPGRRHHHERRSDRRPATAPRARGGTPRSGRPRGRAAPPRTRGRAPRDATRRAGRP